MDTLVNFQRAEPRFPGQFSTRGNTLLEYEEQEDRILCQAPDWEELVGEYLKLIKALANISAAGLIPRLELDGVLIDFPAVSGTLFTHGNGRGHSVSGVGRITGLYLVAGAVELCIEDLRDDRVFQAHLLDTARLAVHGKHPPFTAAIQYSQEVPLLPLLPHGNGKVTIERIWDIEEQGEMEYP